MTLEKRVDRIEHEVNTLKQDIQRTLLVMQEKLREPPPDIGRWRRKAWIISLLNILLALTLFTNLRFYTSISPQGASLSVAPWLRAVWVTLAFVWLLLQMYPLALLISEEEPDSREAGWQNMAKLLSANPGLTLTLTMLTLVLAAISALFPPLWFIVVVALLALVAVGVIGHVLRAGPHSATRKGKQ